MAQHVIVIGAGIIGASVAQALTARGAQVTVLDADGVAGAASGRSFGWINASFFANDAHFQLRHAAMQAHRDLADEVGDTGVIWSGALWFEEQGAAFDAMRDKLTALGYPHRELGRAEFAALEPHVGPVPERSLLFPGEGAVDAATFTRRMLAVSGAKVWLGCAVTGLQTEAGKVVGVQTAQGVLWADHVVIAAGTGAPALVEPLGLSLPMLSRPGVTLHTRPVAPVLRHVLVSPTQEIRQDASGHILAPTVAGHQGDASDTVTNLPGPAADAALARLQHLLPDVALEWAQVCIGWRPVPADGLPVVGEVHPGLTLAVMHSGVTLAALTGRLVADEVVAGRVSPLLATFRPARFQTA